MKKITSFLLLLLLSCCMISIHAQNNNQAKIDSLTTYLKTTGQDTNRVNTLQALGQMYRQIDVKQATDHASNSIELAEQLEFKKGIAYGNHLLGLIEYSQGEFEKARLKYHVAISLLKELKLKHKEATVMHSLGVVELFMGNYTKAQEHFFTALRDFEALGDKKNVADCYSSIANLYGRQGNKDKELEYQTKGLNAKIEFGDQNGISASYINIGNFYGRQNIWDTALIYYFKGLKITESTHNQKIKLNALGNIGTVYIQLGKTKEALVYLMKCYDIASQLGDKQAQITTLNTIGSGYSEIGDQKTALEYVRRALKMAREIRSPVEIKTSYINLSEIYSKTGDYKEAYTYHKLYTDISDTILNAENSKQINEMQAKYDNDKKEKEIELLNKNKEIQDANSKKQQIIIWAVCAGLMVMFILSFFIFKQFKQKQKANTALQSAYHEIEEKNKDITDSINYAKRIQTAILPSIENIQMHLPESFVLYQPKDIVSGDFYWFTEKNNKLIIAVADCTGHGVPGAFMSMIGNDFLTQIVIEKGITQSNLILTHLHNGVTNALKQDNSSETKDGMDIAVLSIENKNGKHTLEFSGALRPLWMIRKNTTEVIEYKGDKHSIGGAYSIEQRSFTNHTLELEKGDTLYISTDGYADQFGGEHGKKFMTKNMKELLLSIQTQTMDQQKNNLQSSLDQWKQDREQVDDVLVIGIRI